jgi:hypothetical protein
VLLDDIAGHRYDEYGIPANRIPTNNVGFFLARACETFHNVSAAVVPVIVTTPLREIG